MRLISLDSNSGDILFEKENCTCLNLNTLIDKKFDERNLISKIQKLDIKVTDLNLCNLASLCYKLKVRYDSFECLEILDFIVNQLRKNYNIKFTQNNIQNKLEVDLRPFDKIFQIDNDNSIIYMNRIFKDKLNYIGFADSQMINLLLQVKNLHKYIPQDLLINVPIKNKETENAYKFIKEILR